MQEVNGGKKLLNLQKEAQDPNHRIWALVKGNETNPKIGLELSSIIIVGHYLTAKTVQPIMGYLHNELLTQTKQGIQAFLSTLPNSPPISIMSH